MKVMKRTKPKKQILLRLAILAFAAYVVVALVDQQMQIRAKKQELESLQTQINIQEMKNEDIKRVIESGDEQNEEYIERAARGDNLNLAYPGERVFINIAGN